MGVVDKVGFCNDDREVRKGTGGDTLSVRDGGSENGEDVGDEKEKGETFGVCGWGDGSVAKETLGEEDACHKVVHGVASLPLCRAEPGHDGVSGDGGVLVPEKGREKEAQLDKEQDQPVGVERRDGVPHNCRQVLGASKRHSVQD